MFFYIVLYRIPSRKLREEASYIYNVSFFFFIFPFIQHLNLNLRLHGKSVAREGVKFLKEILCFPIPL